jgi:hypothetical protein
MWAENPSTEAPRLNGTGSDKKPHQTALHG